MQAITLWQPWASLIADGLKQYETRSWATKHRGTLAIHASVNKTYVPQGPEGLRYPLGAVVAVATLAGCYRTEEIIDSITAAEWQRGDWTSGRYAWLLGHVYKLPSPLAVSGHQRIWGLPTPHREVLTKQYAAFLREHEGLGRCYIEHGEAPPPTPS